MPRFPASTPRRGAVGRQNQRKLQILAFATLQELDDCLTAQPGQRDPVLVGEGRQLRVLAILQVDGHAIPGCHWTPRDRSERTLQQTAPPCYRIRVTSSSVKRCRRVACETTRNAILPQQRHSGRRTHPETTNGKRQTGRLHMSGTHVIRSRKVRGDSTSTEPYRGSVKSRLLPVIRTAPPAVAVAR